MSLVSQIAHSVYVFVRLADPNSVLDTAAQVIFGLTCAFGISFVILLQTMKGNKKVAFQYLFVEFFINIVYYRTYEVFGGGISITDAVIQTAFAFIMPYTISQYSDLMLDVGKEEDKLQQKLSEKVNKKTKMKVGGKQYDVEFID